MQALLEVARQASLPADDGGWLEAKPPKSLCNHALPWPAPTLAPARDGVCAPAAAAAACDWEPSVSSGGPDLAGWGWAGAEAPLPLTAAGSLLASQLLAVLASRTSSDLSAASWCDGGAPLPSPRRTTTAEPLALPTPHQPPPAHNSRKRRREPSPEKPGAAGLPPPVRLAFLAYCRLWEEKQARGAPPCLLPGSMLHTLASHMMRPRV